MLIKWTDGHLVYSEKNKDVCQWYGSDLIRWRKNDQIFHSKIQLKIFVFYHSRNVVCIFNFCSFIKWRKLISNIYSNIWPSFDCIRENENSLSNFMVFSWHYKHLGSIYSFMRDLFISVFQLYEMIKLKRKVLLSTFKIYFVSTDICE
jgi:hypothetical protein